MSIPQGATAADLAPVKFTAPNGMTVVVLEQHFLPIVELHALIKAGYRLLDLISFFTTGEKETRAWTIKRGSTAPVAGAAIHSDFRDKFIRAEVIAWDKLLEAGSQGRAREKGQLRVEGKEYVVQDGDVMEFLHS